MPAAAFELMRDKGDERQRWRREDDLKLFCPLWISRDFFFSQCIGMMSRLQSSSQLLLQSRRVFNFSSGTPAKRWDLVW